MDTLSDAPITPLRQRMQHDMLMRGLGPIPSRTTFVTSGA